MLAHCVEQSTDWLFSGSLQTRAATFMSVNRLHGFGFFFPVAVIITPYVFYSFCNEIFRQLMRKIVLVTLYVFYKNAYGWFKTLYILNLKTKQQQQQNVSTNTFLLSLRGGWSKLHVCSSNQCKVGN